MPAVDLMGQRFGRLTVIKRAKNDKQGNAQWLCLCDCGNEKVVRGRALRKGSTKSCGCLLSECSKKRMTKLCTKHGHSDSKLYRVWCAMRERCYKENNSGFKNYGGRGITVCDEWRNSFGAFYDWAMANGYRKGLEIDRIDNDGNYEPKNCHWITPLENCQNTRKCVHIKVTDCEKCISFECRTIAEASRKTGVNQNTIARIVNGVKTTEKRFNFERI